MADEHALYEDVARRTGLPLAHAPFVVDAVVDALGELLTKDEARAVAKHLPERQANLLLGGAARHQGSEDVESLVAGVAWREHVDRGRALEDVTAVCDALSTRLPKRVRQKLRAGLPTDIARLLTESVSHARPEPRSEPPPTPTRTVATWRPSPGRPLYDAAPDRAHAHSIARNPDPHGDTKLSGATPTRAK